MIAEIVRATCRNEPPSSRPLVLCSGNLAHVYLSGRRPLVHEEVEAELPGMTAVLRRHPAIALVAARAEGGALFIGTPGHQAAVGPGEAAPAKLGLGEAGADLLPRLRALLGIEDSGILVCSEPRSTGA